MKLQMIQNSAARVIMQLRKYDHITETRRELHWLPIPQRIEFSVLTDVYKCVAGNAPLYLSELVLVKERERTTRSANSVLLEFPSKISKNKSGDRAFVYAAPTLWNKLPVHIRTSNSLLNFKKQLKTHLFKSAYKTV